jgi:serine/threonine protein kinase/Tol biopolymer transport system component
MRMIGRRLAHYQITAHLGSGGMGEVYEATDSKLDRSVALKLLPEAFADDPERAARFDREAKTLASLNHPHIASIYGLEESDAQRFLVMELVPGRTLEDRIGGKPLPVDDALDIARQVVEALEAAHEKGIVHRDLKPGNVKITPDGQVKVLDFGLAKLAMPGDDASSGTTVSELATRVGAVLGTPGYMAPEQAKGLPVDRRADIFAFGCLLYEMLTGRPPFDGRTVPEILSQLLEHEPDWTRLPSSLAPSIQRVLRLCLEKNPTKRRQAVGDVRIDLDLALDESVVPAPATPGRRSRLASGVSIVGAVLLAVLATLAATRLLETPAPETRLEIVTPPTPLPLHFALSPDGRYIAFVASESPGDNETRLYLRALNSTVAEPIAGTEGAGYPFWSPDSRSIGFFASERLLRIDVTGGPAQTLATAAFPQGGAWGADGTILFAPTTVGPLLSVSASGGAVIAATELDSPRQKNHRLPSFLPDGRRFLFYAEGESEVSGIFLGSLDGEAPRRLVAARSAGVSLDRDRVAIVQEGVLVARRLDVARRELTGDPVALASSVGVEPSGLFGFSASTAGILAFREAGRPSARRLTWFDGAGNLLEHVEELNGPELSPDPEQRYLAGDLTIDGNRDVWIVDRLRGGSIRLTTHPAVDGYPIWSPKGTELVFESVRNGTFDLWIGPSNQPGDERLLFESPDHEIPIDWSADGRFVLYSRSDSAPDTEYRRSDLWALPMTGEDRTPIAVANTPFEERMGAFSPDGRWVAYDTDQSGRFEVKVQAFPEPSEVFPVSTDGGLAPRWGSNGEIYFVALDGTMMAARVSTTASTFESERPEPLFSTGITATQRFNQQYAVSSDRRFVVLDSQADDVVAPITVVLNWKP